MPDMRLMEFIWCQDCGKVQPLILDYMPADGLNKRAAQDFVCGECRMIIATLHEMAA